MAIITISRGCCSHGQEIAERTAEILQYECLSQEFLMEASQFFRVPEKKLMASIHDAPGFLERITHAREKFLSCIQAALLEHVKKDNVIYHGYAGHLLIPGIHHVLKVRVIAEMEDRIVLLRDRRKMSRSEAVDFIETEDRHRAEWNHHFFNRDMSDPRLYDMILNIGRLRVQEACEIIATAARSEAFRTTPASEKAIRDLALGSHVKAALQDICDAEVTAKEGIVHIKVRGQKLIKTGIASPKVQSQVREQIREDLMQEIMEAIQGIPEIKEVNCNIDLPYYH